MSELQSNSCNIAGGDSIEVNNGLLESSKAPDSNEQKNPIIEARPQAAGGDNQLAQMVIIILIELLKQSEN